MRIRDRLGVGRRVLLLGSVLLAAGGAVDCSVDSNGLVVGADDAGSSGDGPSAGTGGRAGSGGRAGGGGGGGFASGGSSTTGSGGMIASGGRTGVGGRAGAGGQAAAGGRSGTGGRGGASGSGGMVGPGGGGAAGGGAAGGTSAVGGQGGTGGGGQSGGAAGGDVGGQSGGGQGGSTMTGTCNALTCPNGCCMGAMCRTSRNDQRCGTGGVACAPCAPCYQCSNTGVCGLNPSARWDVICTSATIAPTMPLNTDGSWDTGVGGASALPDPYCVFSSNGVVEGVTTTLVNTLAPVWNQSIAPSNGDSSQSFLSSQPWQVSVIDDDFGVSADDLVCSVAPRLTAADFAAGTVAFPPAQSCSSLKIQLVCAQ